jgi:hypothetical protein
VRIATARPWLGSRMVIWAATRIILVGLIICLVLGRLDNSHGPVAPFAKLVDYLVVVLLLLVAGFLLVSGMWRWHQISRTVATAEHIEVRCATSFPWSCEYGAYQLIRRACQAAASVKKPTATIPMGPAGNVSNAKDCANRKPTVRAFHWANAGASFKRQLRMTNPNGGFDLEWRALIWQRQVSDSVIVYGEFRPGSWLVAQLPDGRLVWPACRSQPVLELPSRLTSVCRTAGQDIVCVTERLLTAYALLLKQADCLPLLVRCTPGRAKDDPWKPWWWIGAFRPIVGALTMSHITKRLRLISDGLTREAMLISSEDQKDRRDSLKTVSQECQYLAATAHHRIKLAVASLVGLGPVALAYYTALFPSPHVHTNRIVIVALVGAIYTLSIFFGFAPLLIWLRSIRYKRALFRSEVSAQLLKPSRSWKVESDMNVDELEHDLFRMLGMQLPWDWSARSWISWPLAIGYCALLYSGIFSLAWGPSEGLNILKQYLLVFAVLSLGFFVARYRFILWLRRLGEETDLTRLGAGASWLL